MNPSRLLRGAGLAGAALLLCLSARADYVIKPVTKGDPAQTDIPWLDNRTHRMGNVWLTVNNWGWLGNFNDYDQDAYRDAEIDDWAPQCEVPGGGGVQYVFAAGLWVGALIVDENGNADPRVSTGADGYVAGEAHEFYPGEGNTNVIEERSTRENAVNRLGAYVSSDKAISEQDFITVYTDTLVDNQFTPPVEGVPHEPLGIRITQKSSSWSYNYARDLVIIDYEIENVASKFLRNLFVGLYVDGDVGRRGYAQKNLDDITGFLRTAYDSLRDEHTLINTAWIADNDGRDADIDQGNSFTCPHVTGFRVLRSPNPKLETSYNWWTSSSNTEEDFGPSWQAWADHPDGSWTRFRGTPINDREKYFVLSNGEFDYNQWHVDDSDWVAANPQGVYNQDSVLVATREWQAPSGDTAGVANGNDTRYLVSWGPMGVFDHVDRTGRWIYRLNPGEKFSFTVALVVGRDFHDRNHPQDGSGTLDPSLYNFKSLENNALWAARIYDNELYDTPIFDFGSDGIPETFDGDGTEDDGLLDTGDGWYGEDAGTDGLYADLPADRDSIDVWYFGHFMGWYKGPDADGSENNGELDPGEDNLLWTLSNFIADSGYVYGGPRFGKGGRTWVPVFGGGREQRSFGSGGQPDWFIGHLNLNGVLDRGDGIPDFQGPPPPPPPALGYETTADAVILRWRDNAEGYVDPFSRVRDFEGYRIWVGNRNFEEEFSLLGEYDRVDFAWYDREGRLRTPPDNLGLTGAPLDSMVNGWLRQPVGPNNGLADIINPHGWTEPFVDSNNDRVRNSPEPFTDRDGDGVFGPGGPLRGPERQRPVGRGRELHGRERQRPFRCGPGLHGLRVHDCPGAQPVPSLVCGNGLRLRGFPHRHRAPGKRAHGQRHRHRPLGPAGPPATGGAQSLPLRPGLHHRLHAQRPGRQGPVLGEPGRRHHGLPPLGRSSAGVHQPARAGPDPGVHPLRRPGADHPAQCGRRPGPQLEQPLQRKLGPEQPQLPADRGGRVLLQRGGQDHRQRRQSADRQIRGAEVGTDSCPAATAAAWAAPCRNRERRIRLRAPLG
jgi:hypothetical protein